MRIHCCISFPTDHARLKWCREYLKNTPNRAVAGLHIYTLDNLVRRFFYGHLSRGRRHTGVGIQTVWTDEIMEKEQFPFLKPQPKLASPRNRQTVERGSQSTQEKEYRLAAATGRFDFRGCGYPSKLEDLITFYKAYEARLGSQWADRAGIHRAVAEELSGAPDRAER